MMYSGLMCVCVCVCRRLQEDWAKDVGEGPTILMSLRIDFKTTG